MTELYTLEDGTGVYLLENNDRYRQDFPIIIKNETVGATESKNQGFIKNITSTLGLTDTSNKVTGFVKQAVLSTLGITGSVGKKLTEFAYNLEDLTGSYRLEDDTGIYLQDYPLKVKNETVGAVESSNKLRNIIENISTTIGLTEASNKVTGFVKVATQFLVSVESTINRIITNVNIYLLEDGSGRYQLETSTDLYELDQKQITINISATIGLTFSLVKNIGSVKVISDVVLLVENIVRFKNMIRVLTTATVGLVEAINRLGTIKRNITSTVGITESFNRLRSLIRVIVHNVGLVDSKNKIRGLIKNLTQTIGITEVRNTISGIVHVILDTLGLTESVDRIRTVFISKDFGDFIVTDSYNAEDFIVMDSMDIGDSTVIDSYNFGDFNIIDDN